MIRTDRIGNQAKNAAMQVLKLNRPTLKTLMLIKTRAAADLAEGVRDDVVEEAEAIRTGAIERRSNRKTLSLQMIPIRIRVRQAMLKQIPRSRIEKYRIGQRQSRSLSNRTWPVAVSRGVLVPVEEASPLVDVVREVVAERPRVRAECPAVR